MKSYPGVKALKGISFSVEKGSIHGFLGPNGAGKTTAMNIIAGLSSPTSGQVLVDGKELIREKSFHRISSRNTSAIWPDEGI